MANITRIKAGSKNTSEGQNTSTEPSRIVKTVKVQNKKDIKNSRKEAKKSRKKAKKIAKTTEQDKELKKIFVLFRPFVAFWRYLRDSWRELRQVRWPNRRTTWKMTFAVFIYCIIFLIIIVLLDALFSLIFNNLFK